MIATIKYYFRYLLPLPGAVDISILDAGGSPIRQWVGVALDRGLITEELVLADEPGLGEWTIQVGNVIGNYIFYIF